MTFLHTALLGAGLASVSIPILIHLLLRRRRKPVEWGAMRFLLQAYQRTRRKLVVQRWLLLATRCLLVAAVAIVLGRPLLGAGASMSGAGRTVYVLLDNSLAASALDPSGQPALARHVAAAKSLVDSLGETDRVSLVLLGAPAEPVVLPATNALRGVKDQLDGVKTTDAGADLAGALTRVSAAIADERSHAAGGLAGGADGRTFVAVMSDLLAGEANLEQPLPKLPAGVRLIATSPPPAPAVGNIGIERMTALRQVVVPTDAGQAQTVTVTLMRSGPIVQTAQTVRVRVRRADGGGAGGAGAASVLTSVPFSPGQREASATVALDPATFMAGGTDTSGAGQGGANGAGSAGGASAIVAELDADAVAGDNSFRLPIQMRDSLRVGIVADAAGRGSVSAQADRLKPAQWLSLVLHPADGAGIDVVDVDATLIDGARLAGLDAVLVVSPQRVTDDGWSRLRQFSLAGGLLVVMPPADVTVHTWADAMAKGLKLDRTLARQAKTWDASDSTRPRLVAAGPAGDPGAGGEAGDTGGDLLAPLRGELEELARPVNVWKVLPAAAAAGGTTAPGAGGPDASVLLRLDDGTPLISLWTLTGTNEAGPTGSGAGSASGAGAAVSTQRGVMVYIATAFELSWTDLPAKPLFVPLVHELVRQGIGRARPSTWTVAGTNPPPSVPAQTTELRFVGADSGGSEAARAAGGVNDAGPVAAVGATIAVTDAGRAAEPLRHAGLLTALDNRGGVRGLIAVNADAPAARIEPQPAAALEGWLRATSPEQPPAPVMWLDEGRGAGVGSGGGTGASAMKLLATAEAKRPIGSTPLVIACGLALLEVLLARLASSGSVVASASAARGAQA